MDMQPPAPAAPMPEEAPAGFTVCIQCNPDGTFMVGLDTPEAEAAEQPGQPEAGMKPAKDVKDALTMALQIIKTGGNADQGKADFMAGMNEPMAR